MAQISSIRSHSHRRPRPPDGTAKQRLPRNGVTYWYYSGGVARTDVVSGRGGAWLVNTYEGHVLAGPDCCPSG